MMVPDNKTKMAVMSKVVTVPPNTNLEIFFTCLVLGWKKQTDVWTRINNPVLQILYDEVVVFNESGKHVEDFNDQFKGVGKKTDATVLLARILQYLECPQYLRKCFFPKHSDLQYAGNSFSIFT